MAKVKLVNKVRAAGKQRILNVRPDTPDIRDRYYEPALVQLEPHIEHRGGRILDQGTEGACTGFALTGVINLLNIKRGQAFEASPRMLYEMAQKHDEWPGEDYEGSSCRGAIRGWKNMGVCGDDEWEFIANQPGELTIERAMAARQNPLGAYYRLRPNIVDYHAALNEVDAIFVSARVHSGWFNPKTDGDSLSIIQPDPEPAGGHAFAIVGYNAIGFIVQNSWGEKWGTQGFAIWRYADWQANVSDGWVFRLGIPTPTIFGLEARSTARRSKKLSFSNGRRNVRKIAGHFAHFDDGNYVTRGDYWTTAPDIQQTADRIKDNADWYKHLLVYVHGGLNSPKASAHRIAALKDGFTRNRIYPFHIIMYDTGLAEELKDVVLRALIGAESRAEGFLDWVKDQIIERTDTLIEDAVRLPVTPLWDEMKRGARLPFKIGTNNEIPDGLDVIKILAETLQGTGIKNTLGRSQHGWCLDWTLVKGPGHLAE